MLDAHRLNSILFVFIVKMELFIGNFVHYILRRESGESTLGTISISGLNAVLVDRFLWKFRYNFLIVWNRVEEEFTEIYPLQYTDTRNCFEFIFFK